MTRPSRVWLVLLVAMAWLTPRFAIAQDARIPPAAADADEQQKEKTPKKAKAEEKAAPKEDDAQKDGDGQRDDKLPKEKKKKDPIKFVMVPHPSIRAGKVMRIDFRGRLQEEGNYTLAQSGDQAELDIAKRRLGFEGDLFDKAIAFQVSREMGGQKSLSVVEPPDTSDDPLTAASDSTVTTVSNKFTIDPWREAWIGYQQFTFARAKYGLFKIPFSIDENTGATNLDFAYRSLAASTLAPGRDHGWMLQGQVFNHAFGYEYGVFDHDGHNAHLGSKDPLRVTGGQTTAWRITSEPLRNVNSIWTDLEIGYAEASTNLDEGYSSIKGKTVAGFEFYKSKYFVNGARKRSGFEMRFRPGPFSLKSEYIRVTEERKGESVYNTDLSPLTSTGWYVSGTFALTGEMKTNGLDEPNRPLLRGGFGAIEIGARVEKIAFNSVAGEQAPGDLGSRSHRADVVLRNSDSVLTYGVNWYPNRWLKLQVNLVREDIANPGDGPLPLQASFWSKVIRFQTGF